MILIKTKKKITKIFHSIIYTIIVLLIPKKRIYCWWWESYKMKRNWGDVYNYWLLKKITNKKIVNASQLLFKPKEKVYCMTGSILQSIKGKKIIIWGSGFIDKNYRINKKIQNIEIKSVRGPLTRDILIKQGIKCPKIYGDPALLMPKFYQPKTIKKYELGIIPHYVDQNNNFIKKTKKNENIKIIDITEGIEKVIDDINMCKKIASSTLHGLILADAYQIPSLWIRLSNKIKGGNFKFHDYLLSVNKKPVEPMLINKNTDIKTLLQKIQYKKSNIDLNQLIDACPFDIKKIFN